MHQYLKHFSCLVFKEAVIRKNYRCPTAGSEDVHDMLDKVQLLVACFYGKVFTLRRLVCPFCAKGRIGKDAIILLFFERLINGVAKINLRLKPVEKEVH